MSAAALLAELAAVGVTLSVNGDRLHYQTRPGVSIVPYRERITAHKQDLLTELRQRERAREAAILDDGWRWLAEHPNDSRHEAFEQRWIARLREYEQVSRSHEGSTT